jgi:hypothetical protein
VDIDCDDVDDFHTLEDFKWFGDLGDESIDSCFDELVAFFHG